MWTTVIRCFQSNIVSLFRAVYLGQYTDLRVAFSVRAHRDYRTHSPWIFQPVSALFRSSWCPLLDSVIQLIWSNIVRLLRFVALA